MDYFLLVVTIVLSLLLLAANFYILALYCHKDDKGWGAATYCKVLVILGMILCWAQVLMLPLDIANSQNNAGFDMVTFWYVIMLIILATIVLLLPFAMFMYETDEEKPFMSRVCTSLCFTLIEAVVVTLLLVISWIFFRYADIPVKIFSSGNFVDFNQPITSTDINQTTNNTKLTMETSFPIYCIAFMTFIGWFLLVLFGGVGLSALPIDLIREFTMRPQLMNAKEARDKKSLIQKKVVELMDVGKTLKDEELQVKNYDGGWWSKRKVRKDFETKENLLSVSVYELEKEFDIFQLELKFSESSNKFLGPLVFVGKLILGVIFCFVSLALWVHILVYCVLDAHPFLNNMLTGLLKTPASFLATGIYAFIGLYVLWCCQKGNLKVGIRIPFIMKIHPMKENETWMNSFLFNVITLLICSVAVTQFMVSAFSYYAYLTTIDCIINVQIQYMRWFRLFYEQKVFQISFLAWSGLTFLVLMIRRSDKPKELRELERLRNERKDIQKN